METYCSKVCSCGEDLDSALRAGINAKAAIDAMGAVVKTVNGVGPDGNGNVQITQREADWNQNDSTQSDYVKNRTHWEENTRAIIEWDGNTEGLESIPLYEGAGFYKISDLTPSEEDFYGTVQTGPNHGAEISETGQGMMWISDGVLQAGFLYVITASEFTLEGVTFSVPSPGTYTLFDGTQYFAHTEIGSSVIHTLDEKFIPDTIARKIANEITLVSPGGIPFDITVSDDGVLSVNGTPISGGEVLTDAEEVAF